jgi:hypothetical protein
VGHDDKKTRVNDDFSVEEKQERFLRVIKAALNTPPEPRRKEESGHKAPHKREKSIARQKKIG